MRSIEVIINHTGEITIDAVGFKGADCEKATAFLENALGTKQNRKKKPEYYAARNKRNKQQLGASG